MLVATFNFFTPALWVIFNLPEMALLLPRYKDNKYTSIHGYLRCHVQKFNTCPNVVSCVCGCVSSFDQWAVENLVTHCWYSTVDFVEMIVHQEASKSCKPDGQIVSGSPWSQVFLQNRQFSLFLFFIYSSECPQQWIKVKYSFVCWRSDLSVQDTRCSAVISGI